MVKKTILIVEDSDLTLFYYETALRNAGYRVISTMHGEDAVDICRKEHIDLILLDLYLATSDGFKTVKEIRTFNSVVPVIAQTSYNESEEKLKSIESGCNEFITKPLRLEELLYTVSKYL